MEINHVLITGGLGFLGSRIVQHLREKYPQCLITVLDTRLPSKDGADADVRYVCADITSPPSLGAAFGQLRPQAVIHSAGLVPPLSERYARRMQSFVNEVNVEGTRNVLQAAQSAGARALVYTSSCSAVSDNFGQTHANMDERWPTVEPGQASIYGESKAQAEKLVVAMNNVTQDASQAPFLTCSLRPAPIFGEGDYQLVPSIVKLVTDKKESPYRLGDGMNMWDVVYVGNVADAHILALENLLSHNPTAAGESFFIQNNEPVSVRDLMLFIWKEFNGHIPPFEVTVPIRLAWFFGMWAEAYGWLTGKPSTLSRGSVLDAVATRYASGEKARRVLGYEPRIGLEEGLRRSCQEYAARSRNRTGKPQ